jgi:hypothetical protein
MTMRDSFRANFTTAPFDGVAPASILFFPAGKSEIQARKGGKPSLVTVDINQDVVTTLQADLDAALTAAESGTASRPFVDFQHEGGRAAALPKSFRWEEGKGVMLDLEWTASGKAAVEGKDFSYFSPEWMMKDGQITGLNLPGSVGGLVNTPAFQNIGKIAASFTTMDSYLSNEIMAVLLELGLITQTEVEQKAADAAIKRVRDMVEENKIAAALKTETESIKAAHVKDSSDLITARASITSLTKEIESVKAAHTAELQSVKDSLPLEVAKVVKAAGLPAPLPCSTVNQSAEFSSNVTKAEFARMTPAEKMAFSSKGGKIT